MLAALLRGKLSREQENMEDILTSTVFGVLQYLAPEDGLLPFLSEAVTLDGDRPLAHLTSDARIARFDFWPWISEKGCAGCEPDVLLRLDPPSGRLVWVMIEAKYWSGKSSGEDSEPGRPFDQLAREWDNLVHIAGDEADAVLVYLTADVGIPQDEIEASLAEYRQKRQGLPPTICWLSWRHLPGTLGGDGSIQRDLRALLAERLGLHFYRGIRPLPIVTDEGWRFTVSFRWDRLASKTADWSFAAHYAWGRGVHLPLRWGFSP